MHDGAATARPAATTVPGRASLTPPAATTAHGRISQARPASPISRSTSSTVDSDCTRGSHGHFTPAPCPIASSAHRSSIRCRAAFAAATSFGAPAAVAPAHRSASMHSSCAYVRAVT